MESQRPASQMSATSLCWARSYTQVKDLASQVLRLLMEELCPFIYRQSGVHMKIKDPYNRYIGPNLSWREPRLSGNSAIASRFLMQLRSYTVFEVKLYWYSLLPAPWIMTTCTYAIQFIGTLSYECQTRTKYLVNVTCWRPASKSYIYSTMHMCLSTTSKSWIEAEYFKFPCRRIGIATYCVGHAAVLGAMDSQKEFSTRHPTRKNTK